MIFPAASGRQGCSQHQGTKIARRTRSARALCAPLVFFVLNNTDAGLRSSGQKARPRQSLLEQLAPALGRRPSARSRGGRLTTGSGRASPALAGIGSGLGRPGPCSRASSSAPPEPVVFHRERRAAFEGGYARRAENLLRHQTDRAPAALATSADALALHVFQERQLFRVVDAPVAKIVVIENSHLKLSPLSAQRKALQRTAGWPLQ